MPACTATFTLALVTAVAQGSQDGFVDLWNGTDLAGWVNVNGAPETWRVQDGVLACSGKPICALRTERMYENFELELEWRHLESGGNAGIFVWASPLAVRGVPFLRAVEVQVLDHGYGNTDSYTTHGDVFPIHGSTMVPFGRHKGMRSFPSESRSKPAPEWNHYRIVANDGVLRLSVNGKEVSGGEKCNWRKGYLGLESEGAPTEWRRIRIKELPSTGASPEVTADPAQGHRPLYNGVDLRGWRVDDAAKSSFAAADWVLRLDGRGKAGHRMTSEAEFSDFELVVDVKIGKADTDARTGLDGGFCFTTGDAVPTVLAPFTAGDSGLQRDRWHRIVVQRRGSALTVTHDGKPAAAPDKVGDGPGHLVLVHPGHGVELSNLYLRALNAAK